MTVTGGPIKHLAEKAENIPSPEQVHENLQAVGSPGLTRAGIMVRMGMKRTTVYDRLKVLIRAGKVARFIEDPGLHRGRPRVFFFAKAACPCDACPEAGTGPRDCGSNDPSCARYGEWSRASMMQVSRSGREQQCEFSRGFYCIATKPEHVCDRDHNTFKACTIRAERIKEVKQQ